jgi:hypothetical protein
VSQLAAVGVAALLVLAHSPALDAVERMADHLLFNKLATRSGVERSTWAQQSLVNFVETVGLGITPRGDKRLPPWGDDILAQAC